MNENGRSFKIFVDFDGTISSPDVGETMFHVFGDKEKVDAIVEKWMNDEVASPEAWKFSCETVSDITPEKFENFLDTISIDPYFKNFVEFCEKNNFEICVLSDGFDYYIKYILKKAGLGHLKFYSNKLNFMADNKLEADFPFQDEECRKCGNCKRNQIINHSSDEDYTIFIGDGFSDKCPAQYCDFIFAKKSLLRYCEMNRISYFPFSDFGEIIERITELKSKKRLKKRHQAELKRREVYIQG